VINLYKIKQLVAFNFGIISIKLRESLGKNFQIINFFFSFRNGFDSGSLNVYLRKSDGTLGNPIWTKKGNYGNT
jgi:hypothetical protein